MIAQKLEAFPRVSLATYPTPLEQLPNLSKQLGREIYVKRDDSIGPAMGGSKTRKLEYLIADARQRGMRRVVTFGGSQSNHARITAAAARCFDLEPHLFYFERRPTKMTGNLLLNELLGAKMHFVPFASGGNGNMRLETANRLVHALARVRVGRHYFIPVGGHSWRGCLGYVRAALELDEQAKNIGLKNAWLIVGAGTGGTLAGLMAGLALGGSSMKVLGIDVGKLWKAFPASIAQMANDLCERLDHKALFTIDDVPLIEYTYVGEQYGVPSAQGNSAIHLLAELEGLLLDPIYTGKAFAGLLDLIEKGKLGKDEPVIFLHTGGVPALFAFDEEHLHG